jgi:hypothetical protein
MAIQIRHYGIVRAGRVLLHNLLLYKKNLVSLEGKQIEFTIKELHETPTRDQYAYYRGGVIETALTAECFGGWTGDEVDKYFSDKFLGYNVEQIIRRKTGLEHRLTRVIPSKDSSFPKKEMAIFIDKCIMELAQEGVEVLSPELYKLIKFQTKTK